MSGKEGKKLQKFEYLENEKSFLDEIKNIFHSFWRPIIWWKNKNLIKIADTSFKGATKSYREIIFVSATKIGENTINILNCYFSS